MAEAIVTPERPVYFAKVNISFYQDTTEPTLYPNNFEKFIPLKLLDEANTELAKYRKLGDSPAEIEDALNKSMETIRVFEKDFGTLTNMRNFKGETLSMQVRALAIVEQLDCGCAAEFDREGKEPICYKCQLTTILTDK